MNPTTVQKIHDILTAGREASEPQNKILAYIASRDGKKLTKRDEKIMRETIDPSIYFGNSTGRMPHVEWGNYSRTGGKEGGSLLLEYTDSAPIANSAWVREHNARHFDAAVKRNEARDRALADGLSLLRAARAIDALNASRAELEALIEHEAVLGVIRYPLIDLAGLGKER